MKVSPAPPFPTAGRPHQAYSVLWPVNEGVLPQISGESHPGPLFEPSVHSATKVAALGAQECVTSGVGRAQTRE
eukprot:15450512-Alexandrium_andersonii.AAC.1